MTLNNEYHRDLKKGLHPELPGNYHYEDNDPFNVPVLSWRNTSNTPEIRELAEFLCIPDDRLYSDGG